MVGATIAYSVNTPGAGKRSNMMNKYDTLSNWIISNKLRRQLAALPHPAGVPGKTALDWALELHTKAMATAAGEQC